eukprot:1107887-Rhodomonas_salina.1
MCIDVCGRVWTRVDACGRVWTFVDVCGCGCGCACVRMCARACSARACGDDLHAARDMRDALVLEARMNVCTCVHAHAAMTCTPHATCAMLLFLKHSSRSSAVGCDSCSPHTHTHHITSRDLQPSQSTQRAGTRGGATQGERRGEEGEGG